MVLRIELPFDFNFRHSQGIHLVKDGGLFHNDVYDVEEDKVDIEKWTEVHETVHDCISNGDCRRCTVNDRVEFNYISFTTDKGTFTFVSSINDQLGAIPTDYAMV